MDLQDDNLWMVLPYIQGGSVESAMKYAFPKVRLPGIMLADSFAGHDIRNAVAKSIMF